MADPASTVPAERLQELQKALAEPVVSAAAAEALAALARRILLTGGKIPPETQSALDALLLRYERRERFRLHLKRNGILLAVLAASLLIGSGFIAWARAEARLCRTAQCERALQAADFPAVKAMLAAETDPALKALLAERLRQAEISEAARRTELAERIARAKTLLQQDRENAAEFALTVSGAELLARTPEERHALETLRSAWSQSRLARETAARQQAQKTLRHLLQLRKQLEKELNAGVGTAEKSWNRYQSELTAALAAVPPGRDREPLMALFRELPELVCRVEKGKSKSRK